MNPIPMVAVLALLLTAPLSAQPSGQDKTLLGEFQRISSHDLLSWVQKLSSAEFAGRLTGTPEYRRAADWVADQLKGWGVKPAGDQGGYLLDFSAPTTTVDSVGSITVTGPFGTRELEFPKDYFPGSNSASGDLTAELVYAGFGISAPELGYDDYRKTDVAGKIVLVESGAPYEKNDPTLARWAGYSGSQHKVDNAVSHGAAGILFLEKVANPGAPYHERFLAAHLDARVANDLLAAAGKNQKTLREEIVRTLRPHSFATGMKARLVARTTRHPEGIGCTVAGLLPGSDPLLKEEVLIVGGHLDHVGTLGVVFPGAFDNASGCAVILAAARALGTSEISRKRSILFLFFGGEETGLVGSTRYVEKPIFPLEKVKAFFNLDMVGNGTGLAVGAGLTYPRIGAIFTAANERWIHRPFRLTERRVSFGRPRSDGAVFAKNGYPAMSISTTDADKPVYYHDPGDTWEMVSPEIMEDAAKLLFLGLTEAACSEL